jgi:cell division transport system permease protein
MTERPSEPASRPTLNAAPALARRRRAPGPDAEPLHGGPRFSRDDGLIPAASIAGRSLATVIAIMTLLAALAAALSLMVFDASAEWRSAVAQEMTVQIAPRAGRDLDADVAAAAAAAAASPGVASARALDKAASDALLEPWLGKLDLGALPVPRMVVIARDPAGGFDPETLKATLAKAAPSATLDDHHFWLERLADMANALAFGAAAIFVLILVAIGTAVGFATRGAMAGAREIVDVLHVVGASDAYIARQFQRHFFRLAARGAAIGAASAALVVICARFVLRAAAQTPTEMQFDLLFGSFSFGWRGFLSMMLVAVGIAALAAFVSRWIVMRRLRGRE